MRLATFESKRLKKPQAGVVIGERIIPLRSLDRFPDTVLELIRRGPDEWERLRSTLSDVHAGSMKVDSVTLLAPIPTPVRNIMCLGWNYAAHAREKALGTDVSLPDHPIVFTKAPTTVNGPFGQFEYDRALSEEIDWEVELAVIIGVGGRRIPVEKALNHIFGYTVLNDMTARDIQRRHQQFFLGKSLDGACPMGPWIVTADEIEDPQSLGLKTYVNGVLKQDGNTADQIFSVAETISILSQGMTLEAGDIIGTGTPEGVGSARKPPEFLHPGHIVACEVDGIGRIETRIISR